MTRVKRLITLEARFIDPENYYKEGYELIEIRMS